MIASIDACHDENTGKLVVYLTWKNGHKTQHDTKIVYSRCPQKVGYVLPTHAGNFLTMAPDAPIL